MDLLYILIPVMLFSGTVMFILLYWAMKSDQFDDLDGEAHRILMDDDDPLLPTAKSRKIIKHESNTLSSTDR